MINLLKDAFLLALIFHFCAMADTGKINNEHKAGTHESKILFYDWKEDELYGYKINRIISELDLSEFRYIIARCNSPEMPDGNYIVTPDSPELSGVNMYYSYSLKMQDGKIYNFPRVITAPDTPYEDTSNKILIKGFRNIGESVWKDGINNAYLVCDILIDIENKSASPIILLGQSLTGDEQVILPIFKHNNQLYTIIHERNIYIPPMSVYRLHGRIIPHPAKRDIKPTHKMHVMKLPEKMKDVYIELAFQTVIIGKKIRVLPQKFIYRSKFTKGSY